MKRIRIIILLICVAFVLPQARAIGYGRLSASYENIYYTNWDVSTNGVGLNYVFGVCILKKQPLFVEVGASLVASFHGSSRMFNETPARYQYQNFRVNVPVNISWRFNLGKNIAISPFVGFMLMGNFYNSERAGKDGLWTEWVNYKNVSNENWKSTEGAWQVGTNINYKRWFMNLHFWRATTPAMEGVFHGKEQEFYRSCFGVGIGWQF